QLCRYRDHTLAQQREVELHQVDLARDIEGLSQARMQCSDPAHDFLSTQDARALARLQRRMLGGFEAEGLGRMRQSENGLDITLEIKEVHRAFGSAPLLLEQRTPNQRSHFKFLL